jgi:type I restriction enzyme S subunit
MEKQNIPSLRFPEFQDIWINEKFGSVATNKSKKYNAAQSKDSFNCIELEHLASQTGQILGFINSQNSGSTKNVFSKGDVLFGKLRPYLKKYLIAPFDGVCSSEIWVIKGKEASNKFLYLIVQSEKFIALANQSTGSKMPRADWSVISNEHFKFPTLPEQQKIASFLTEVDNKLQALKRKAALLEQYKKGMMQKLFSQALRFKDENGQPYPNWEKKKLGEIANVFDGTHQTPKYVEKGVPFYSVEHVTANQFAETKYITEEVFEKENKRVKLEKGDILMTKIGDIGTPKYLDWEVNASFYVSLALIKCYENMTSEYLNQFIISDFFQKELWKRTIHVAFPKKINLGEISNCIVQRPEIEEQTKIANFLTAIDQKIEQVSQQIAKAETWKKGLLQKMFV